MISYPYSIESNLVWWDYQPNHVSGLLFVRIGFCWLSKVNQFDRHIAPGIVPLGYAHVDPQKAQRLGLGSPILQRFFFADTRADTLDNLAWERSAWIAKPTSLVAGSPEFERPGEFERPHPSSTIIHERKFGSANLALLKHSRTWGYEIGGRPARYDRPSVFGYGFGGGVA